MTMESLLLDGLDAYAARHSGPVPAIYDALREATLAETDLPQMQVGPLVGRFLMLLTRLIGARRAVEIGTFTGYSSLSIAEGLAVGGQLITCDIDPHATGIARRFWDQTPWGHRIALRLGPALDTLAELEGPLDLAFIDADKTSYTAYWEAIVPMMRPGGVVLVDNVLWGGSVLDPATDSARAIAALNDRVSHDERVDHVLLTLRDGLMMAVKR